MFSICVEEYVSFFSGFLINTSLKAIKLSSASTEMTKLTIPFFQSINSANAVCIILGSYSLTYLELHSYSTDTLNRFPINYSEYNHHLVAGVYC